MIKTIDGTIKRSSHYGSQGNEEFCLEVRIGLCAKEYNRLKKKRTDIVQSFLVALKNTVYDATGLGGVPHIGTASRAKKGIKMIQATFYMHKDIASQIGADVKEWCLYHSVDLQSHLENNRTGNLFAKSAIKKAMSQSEMH